MMTLKEFENSVDLYSADLARWPQDKMRQALLLMESDPRARACFDKALKVDDALRSLEAPGLSYPALETRIMRDIAGIAQERTPLEMLAAQKPRASFLRPAMLFAPGGSLLAVAILGFFMGFDAQVQGDYFSDPVFYSQDQILADDADFLDEEVL